MCGVTEKLGVRTPSKEDVFMPDTARIQMLIDAVQEFLGGWLEQKLTGIYGAEYWQRAVLSVLDERQQRVVREDGSKCPQELDLPMQVSVFRNNWVSLLEQYHLNRQLYNDAVAVKLIRNKYDHKKRNTPVDEERYRHDIETVYLFLKELGADSSLLGDVRRLINPCHYVDPAKQQAIKICVSKIPSARVCEDAVQTETTTCAVSAQHSDTEARSEKPTQEIVVRIGSSSCDEAYVNECKKYLDMVWNSFPRYFDSDSIIISQGKETLSPVNGKGTWDYLVLLHVKSEGAEACRAINSFYTCPDTTPYLQGDYLVWQFPRFEEDPEEYNVANVYPVGVLPTMFDDYISSKPGTNYNPDCKVVSHNDDATMSRALWYLGNYFPRSFSEAFCIYDYLLTYVLPEVRAGRDGLTICDVGMGSGGATFGLLWALRKRLIGDKTFKRIKVYGLDVNENALQLCEEMVPLMRREWPIEMEFITRRVRFSQLGIIPDGFIKEKVDFVISAKCLQEISSDDLTMKGLYKRYFEEAQKICGSGVVSIMEIFRPARSRSLTSALSHFQDSMTSLVPNGDGKPVACEEHFRLNSSRIGRLVGENIVFSVVGPEKLKSKMPEWVPAPVPVMNEQDLEQELNESEIVREG